MKIEEALQRFTEDNEKYDIYFATGDVICVTILEIGNGFIRIDDGYSESIVNIDYIMRVRALPQKKKDKKKSIF
ncbi:MAG: hypothetical protein NC040_08465 [Muribaculaceae bacterium]|nr:hypothetical protein [Alistipes senegalensis]MCM1474079.1 hypothetical protein [Muribaculaceae bacterium]